MSVLASTLRAVDETGVNPGVLGFVVVALLGVATWLLIRSMNRQIKRIDIPEGGTPTDPGAEGGTAPTPVEPTEEPRGSAEG